MVADTRLTKSTDEKADGREHGTGAEDSQSGPAREVEEYEESEKSEQRVVDGAVDDTGRGTLIKLKS